MNRKQAFKLFSGLEFNDLVGVDFNTRDATNYYYHEGTNTKYSYYFGSNNPKWTINPPLMEGWTYEPKVVAATKEPIPVEPNQNEMAGKKVILEITKLELEIRKLELEIVYIDTKTRNLDKKAKTIRTNK